MGVPTDKYFAIQKVIKEEVPTAKIAEPIYPKVINLGTHLIQESVGLFSVLEDISTPIIHDYTLPMEQLDQNFGYILYRNSLGNKRYIKKLKAVNASDRVQFFINQEMVATQYQETLGEEISFEIKEEHNELSVLVENMGRNNYGPKLVADTQRKGIRSGVMEDIHYIADWAHYCLELTPAQLAKIDFSKEANTKSPSFYKTVIYLSQAVNTFLDCSRFVKGVVFVNGQNMGRYWSVGPVKTLYIADYFWQEGANEIIIFETEGVAIDELCFTQLPIIE